MARWHTWLNSSGCPQEYYSATTRPLLLLLSLPSNPPSLPLCGPSTAQTTSRLSTSRTTAQNTRNLCGKVNAIPFLPSYDLMTPIAPDSSAPQSCQGGKGLSDKRPKHLPSRTILRRYSFALGPKKGCQLVLSLVLPQVLKYLYP